MVEKSLCRHVALCAVGLCLALLFPVLAFAQETYVTGTVYDENDEPMMGVTVANREMSTGTATSMEGKYRVRASKGQVLTFSFVGYETQRITWSGTTPLDVHMRVNAETLDEVVVTALGIKREARSLGYSTENLDGESITHTMPSNWSSALSGKVSGLNIVSPGGPLGSTRVSLRGDISLNVDGNAALIVVDGVPMSSKISNPGVAYAAGGNSELSVDYGNGFADINPSDIADIQVLKGAGATALYGSRAANGAIIITTKNGSSGSRKGIGLSISSAVTFEDIMRWPDYQYEFGQGRPTNIGKKGTEYEGELYYSYGASPDGNPGTSGTSSAFGARFDPSRLFYQYDPVTQTRSEVATPWVAYPNNRKDLFRTGVTSTSTVALTSNHKGGSLRGSITYSNNRWILPNTGYDRFTVSISGTQSISDKIRMNYSTSYTRKDVHNTPGLGYNSNSISYFLIFQNPNVNLDWLRPMWRIGQEGFNQLQPYSSYIGNPFVILHEATNPALSQSNRTTLSVTYDITPELSLMARTGVRIAADHREQHRPISDVVYRDGFFKQQNILDYEINTDMLLTWKKDLTKEIGLTASLGGNMMESRYDELSAATHGLKVPRVYNLANALSTPEVKPRISNKAINSLYFVLNTSYKNALFLDITGRNDWSSTLPEANRSYFYPSVNLSAVVNELVEMPSVISLLKLRGSWAQVGNDTSPYKTSQYYTTSELPGSLILPTTLYNQEFLPEISTNYEVGFDYRMFDDRLSVDLTYYYNRTRNQILDAPIDPTTGYTRATINSGTVQNMGLELELGAIPVVTPDFKWTTKVTWSTNQNKILSLAEGSDENQVIASVGGTFHLIGTVGGSVTDIWGYKLVRNEDGHVVIGKNGLPERPSEIERVGNASPKWRAGWLNQFSYKGLSVSILLDGQYGGLAYSQSHHKMTEQGKLAHTLNGRLPGTDFYIPKGDPRILADPSLTNLGGIYMVIPGVVRNGDGSYSPNEQLVTVESYYKDYYRRANVETNTFDTSFIKLREISVGYSLPKKWLDRTFISGCTVSAFGRNLLCFTKYPLYDPETAALNSSSIVVGIENGALPSTKSYGLNFSIAF